MARVPDTYHIDGTVKRWRIVDDKQPQSSSKIPKELPTTEDPKQEETDAKASVSERD